MSNVSRDDLSAARVFDTAAHHLHETADPVAADNCFSSLRANASAGASIVDATNDASRTDAPVVLKPELLAPVVGEHGFFASLYLRLRDWLVDRFPGLDRFLPEGGRSGAEKAMVYALKVRDTVRAQADTAPHVRHELAAKRDAYLNIIRNAADPASARCSTDMESAQQYCNFAASFAQVAEEYPQEGAFDSLLPLFADGTVQAPHLVDRSDLPLLARMAVELESDGADGCCSNLHQQILSKHLRNNESEAKALEEKAAAAKARMEVVHTAVMNDDGEIKRLARDDTPDATALRDLSARHRANVSSLNSAHEKVEAVASAANHCRVNLGHLDRALNILAAAAGEMPPAEQRDAAVRLADMKQPAPVPQTACRTVAWLERAPTAASLLGQTDSIQLA